MDVANYVEEYFKEYKYLSTVAIPNVNNFSNFTFGFRNYDTKAVISSEHGVALYFSPSQTTAKISFDMINYPVEYYLWPKMSTDVTNLKSVAILPGEYPLDGIITVDNALLYIGPGAVQRCTTDEVPLNVTNRGAVMIYGTYIVGHSLFTKGSINQEDWSTIQADLDALSQYLFDCKSSGVNDGEIQDFRTKYEPSILLDQIGSRMKSGVYSNDQALFNADYERLRSVSANTMDDMLTKVLDDYYTLQQMPEPSLIERIFSYLLEKIDALVMGVLIAVLGVVATKYVKGRNSTRKTGDLAQSKPSTKRNKKR